MNEHDSSVIVQPGGESGLVHRLPADQDGDASDCIPCDELGRIRAALVEMRRGVVSLERGLAALFAAVDRTGQE